MERTVIPVVTAVHAINSVRCYNVNAGSTVRILKAEGVVPFHVNCIKEYVFLVSHKKNIE